jgi:hypothetical protein
MTLTSQQLQQKAAGYLLAAANASKKETSVPKKDTKGKDTKKK